MAFLRRVCWFSYEYKITGLFLILFVLLLHPAPGIAQLSQPARFELDKETGDHAFTLVSLKDNGISMIRQKQKSEGNKMFWEIVLLDTALQQTWTTQLALDSRLTLVGYEYVPGELFFLFRQGESNTSDLHLIRIYLLSHAIQEFHISPKLDFRLTHFIVVGGSAVMGGYTTRQSTVLLFEMESSHLKVIPGFFIDNTELLELKGNRNKTFNILLMERGAREKKLLLLKTFDESGSLLLEDDIEIDAGKVVQSGTTSTLGNDELFLAGTWGLGVGKQSVGFYSVLVDPFKKQPVHYYDFGELDHFFDYVGLKRAEKIKKKAEERRKAKRFPNYQADVHIVKMEENEKGFLLLSELYVPATNTNYAPFYNYSPYYANSPYYYSPYGYNPMMMNRYFNSPYYNSPNATYNQNADVTVIHSSLIIFDQQGKLKQDFGFAIDGVKLLAMDQVSDFFASEKIIQFYKKEKEIYSSTSWEDGNAPEQDTLKIQLKSGQDVVRDESDDQGGVRYWYGPYAYVWGYETIKNKGEQSGDRVRYVYYVNKIKLE